MGLWGEFVTIVDKHFKYLETEFGFKWVSNLTPFVIYESSSLRLKVFWEDDGHHEVDLGIDPFQRIDKHNISFGISELVRLHHPKESESYESSHPRTKEDLDISVRELAMIVKKYGSDVLRGDLKDLERIEKLREQVGRKMSWRHSQKH